MSQEKTAVCWQNAFTNQTPICRVFGLIFFCYFNLINLTSFDSAESIVPGCLEN